MDDVLAKADALRTAPPAGLHPSLASLLATYGVSRDRDPDGTAANVEARAIVRMAGALGVEPKAKPKSEANDSTPKPRGRTTRRKG